ANVPPPTSKIARDPQVRRAGRSVVKVLGTACGLGIEGSGWMAGQGGIVVTNAHVVAGESDTTVQLRGTGPRFAAQPIWFDPRNAVAILRVPSLASVTRKVTALRGRVRSGNSGGPVVDGGGRVLGTVFAATTGGGDRGGFAVPDTVVRSALGHASANHRVGTGPCAD